MDLAMAASGMFNSVRNGERSDEEPLAEGEVPSDSASNPNDDDLAWAVSTAASTLGGWMSSFAGGFFGDSNA